MNQSISRIIAKNKYFPYLKSFIFSINILIILFSNIHCCHKTTGLQKQKSSSLISVQQDSLDLITNINNLDTAKLPRYTIRVNIHYIHSANGGFHNGPPSDDHVTNGNIWAQRLINHINSILRDLQYSATSKAQFLGDSRMRVELYSDPTETSDSTHGVWYWKSKDQCKYLYGDSVLHIFIVDYDQNKDCNLKGYACGLDFCNELVLQDAYDNALNQCIFGWWSFASLFCHEMGHIMGLCHSFYCDNECKDVDLDIARECNKNPCYSDCGGPNSGFCNNWPSGSNNMMGYNANQNALSPCQWKKLFTNLVFTKAKYVVRHDVKEILR
ncbi:MAG: hypothetical protein IPK88_02240 [Saprospiraceae bacterium]|nr:hypothetical protein [Candidatus Defluviibacterium haderslevense]